MTPSSRGRPACRVSGRRSPCWQRRSGRCLFSRTGAERDRSRPRSAGGVPAPGGGAPNALYGAWGTQGLPPALTHSCILVPVMIKRSTKGKNAPNHRVPWGVGGGCRWGCRIVPPLERAGSIMRGPRLSSCLVPARSLCPPHCTPAVTLQLWPGNTHSSHCGSPKPRPVVLSVPNFGITRWNPLLVLNDGVN